MSLWVLTICLGLLPGNLSTPPPINVSTPVTATVQGPTTGPLQIVSRLGTTLEPYTATNVKSFSGNNVQISAYNNAVRILRSHRNSNSRNVTQTDNLNNILKKNNTLNIVKTQSGACVAAGTCIRNRIDVRILTPQVPCPTGQEYCGTISTKSIVSNITCGVTQPVHPSPIILEPGQAGFGEIPWQGALIKMPDYISGIVLIDGLNVLTVAHKLSPYIISGLPDNLLVRLGDWTKPLNDSVTYQEYSVVKVFSHPMYNPNTLENDIAVLRLALEVPFTLRPGTVISINRACLPPSSSPINTGQRCVVSGRSYQMFGPKAFIKELRKKVDVSIRKPQVCQSQLRATRLGSDFTLQSSSFICAGAETDEDTCMCEAGSGLLCEVEGKWQIVGLFTRGLGCGNADMPGVYVNVVSFLPWIRETIVSS